MCLLGLGCCIRWRRMFSRFETSIECMRSTVVVNLRPAGRTYNMQELARAPETRAQQMQLVIRCRLLIPLSMCMWPNVRCTIGQFRVPIVVALGIDTNWL